MKTTLLKTDIWKDEDLFKLHLDSKLLYFFILSSPERGLIHIFKWTNRAATYYTGLSVDQVQTALNQLTSEGYVEVYNNYICILKEHLGKAGNRYKAINEEREFGELPEDVYAYFVDKKPVPPQEKVKKTKKLSKDEVKEFIASQPIQLQEALTAYVEHRIARKNPPTTQAVKLWINKVNKWYPNNFMKQAAVFEQSVERGWMGIFELKVDNNAKSEEREFL